MSDPAAITRVVTMRVCIAVALFLVLFGGLLLFDQFGPVVHRSAVVIGTHTEITHLRTSTETDFFIDGIDDHRGTFSLDVSEYAYNNATAGTRISIDRSVVTARIVNASIPNWRPSNRTGYEAFLSILVLGGAGLMWWSVGWIKYRYLPMASPRQHRIHIAIMVALIIAVVIVMTIITFSLRSGANLSSVMLP